MQDITICPVCGGDTFIQHLACVDYTVSQKTFNIINCQSCGLKITTPRPWDSDVSNYYLSEKYISHTNKAQTFIDKIYLIARRYTLKEKLKLISNYQKLPGKILDYGCGTGEFLNTCKQARWDIKGVEPSNEARSKATELTNEKILSSLTEIRNTNFDVTTLWHVLEHVSTLDDTLQEIYKLLRKDGTIYIAVPNHKSYEAERYKQYWAGYDVPRHLWHFSPDNMQKLLHKNSFKVIKIIPMKLDSFYISLLSEKYKRNGKVNLLNMAKAAYNGLISNLNGRKTGNYSSLIYIAQK